MKINFESTRGCINLEDEAKKCMYEALSKGQWWTRLTGIPLGIVSGGLTITTRIGTIGECLFKGTANIADSIEKKDSKLLFRGLKQLFISSTKSAGLCTIFGIALVLPVKGYLTRLL